MSRCRFSPFMPAAALLLLFLLVPGQTLAGPQTWGDGYSTATAARDPGDADDGDGPQVSVGRSSRAPDGTYYRYRLRLRRNLRTGRVISKATTTSFLYQGGPVSDAYYLAAGCYLCRGSSCTDWAYTAYYNVYKVVRKWRWLAGYSSWYTQSYHYVEDHGQTFSQYLELSRYL